MGLDDQDLSMLGQVVVFLATIWESETIIALVLEYTELIAMVWWLDMVWERGGW